MIQKGTTNTPPPGRRWRRSRWASWRWVIIDCNTIPFLWNYADRFTLFDNFHQTTIGPSTPNAIAMIAGQTGETQWALHASQPGITAIVPVTGDPGPFAGSNLDTSADKPPYGPDENPASPNGNLTFATLPLSFMGKKINQIIAQDENPTADLLDVQQDITTIASKNPNVNWGWYQQGFGPEPFDGTSFSVAAVSANRAATAPAPASSPGATGRSTAPTSCITTARSISAISATTPTEQANMHGLAQFFTDIANQALPAEGRRVLCARRLRQQRHSGAAGAEPQHRAIALFAGNDDHPGYSDALDLRGIRSPIR